MKPACACGLLEEEPEAQLRGMRVVQADSLPEGIIMFVRQGRTVGIIDNRVIRQNESAYKGIERQTQKKQRTSPWPAAKPI